MHLITISPVFIILQKVKELSPNFQYLFIIELYTKYVISLENIVEIFFQGLA